jgi:hypothetical protein
MACNISGITAIKIHAVGFWVKTVLSARLEYVVITRKTTYESHGTFSMPDVTVILLI